MRERFYRFMQGRYGQDALGNFLSITALVLMVASFFPVLSVLYLFAMGLIVVGFYRILSRNHFQRSRENQAYLRIRGKLTGRFTSQKNRFRQRKTHRIYPCPSCRTQCRVPRGRGRVRITCPSCRTVFEKNT